MEATQTAALPPAVQAVMDEAPEGFADYLAARGYRNPAQLTVGLLRAYARAMRTGKNLARGPRRFTDRANPKATRNPLFPEE